MELGKRERHRPHNRGGDLRYPTRPKKREGAWGSEKGHIAHLGKEKRGPSGGRSFSSKRKKPSLLFHQTVRGEEEGESMFEGGGYGGGGRFLFLFAL